MISKHLDWCKLGTHATYCNFHPKHSSQMEKHNPNHKFWDLNRFFEWHVLHPQQRNTHRHLVGFDSLDWHMAQFLCQKKNHNRHLPLQTRRQLRLNMCSTCIAFPLQTVSMISLLLDTWVLVYCFLFGDLSHRDTVEWLTWSILAVFRRLKKRE